MAILTVVAGLVFGAVGFADADASSISFSMMRSGGAASAGCIPNAGAQVTVTSVGSVEVMKVAAFGLPANTEFDLFVTHLPNGPFGMS
jgi:hypothetical protein